MCPIGASVSQFKLAPKLTDNPPMIGSVPHSGFGMGVERTVSYLCGLQHLREAIPFPRMLNRLNP